MMNLVIILVILLVISLPAYEDARGRRNPPLPFILQIRTKKRQSQLRLPNGARVSGENHLRPAGKPGGHGTKIIAAGDRYPRQLCGQRLLN